MSAEEKKPSLVNLARQALEEEARLKKAKEKVDLLNPSLLSSLQELHRVFQNVSNQKNDVQTR